MTTFDKPIYDLPGLLGDVGRLSARLPTLALAVARGRLPGAFRERLMLAATGVNRCRYCATVHGALGLASGLRVCEVESLLQGGGLEGFPKHERIALQYARHFARSGGRPDRPRREQLERRYGPPQAAAIDAALRAIHLANVTGNTFDAFLARLWGRPAPGSRLALEAGVFATAAPALLPLLGTLAVLGLLRRAVPGVPDVSV